MGGLIDQQLRVFSNNNVKKFMLGKREVCINLNGSFVLELKEMVSWSEFRFIVVDASILEVLDPIYYFRSVLLDI